MSGFLYHYRSGRAGGGTWYYPGIQEQNASSDVYNDSLTSAKPNYVCNQSTADLYQHGWQGQGVATFTDWSLNNYTIPVPSPTPPIIDTEYPPNNYRCDL